MALDDETFQMLGKAAALAGTYGMKKQAAELAAVLREIAPDDEDVQILHAGTCMQTGDFDGAKKILLDEVLKKNPDNTSAKGLLGVVYHLQEKPGERDRVLQQVVDAGDAADDEAKTIAAELINS